MQTTNFNIFQYSILCWLMYRFQECEKCRSLQQKISNEIDQNSTLFVDISSTDVKQIGINFYNKLYSAYLVHKLKQNDVKRKIRVLSLFDGLSTRNFNENSNNYRNTCGKLPFECPTFFSFVLNLSVWWETFCMLCFITKMVKVLLFWKIR